MLMHVTSYSLQCTFNGSYILALANTACNHNNYGSMFNFL